jgi:cob(I)alamin adenosyltransferase
MLNRQQVNKLDDMLEKYNAQLPPLKEFILPGGSRTAAMAHVCRTVCRRAERSVVALRKQESVSELALQFLNRLSDLLFVLARVLNQLAQQNDELWARTMEEVYR